MKITIDESRCTGHARCVVVAPSLFTDDERGYGVVIGDGDVPADQVAAARSAVNSCPEQAISLSE